MWERARPEQPAPFFPSHAPKLCINQCPSSGGAVLRALHRHSPAKVGGRALGYHLRPNSSQSQCQKLVMSLRALWKQGLSSQIFFPDSQRLIPALLNQWQNSHSAEGKHDLLPNWAFPAAACSFQALRKGRIVPYSCSARDQETPLACLI